MVSRSGLGAKPTLGPIAECGCANALAIFGGDIGGVIPDPIPNSEVKPSGADGTARATAWESRTPPELTLPRLAQARRGFFCAGITDVGAVIGPADP